MVDGNELGVGGGEWLLLARQTSPSKVPGLLGPRYEGGEFLSVVNSQRTNIPTKAGDICINDQQDPQGSKADQSKRCLN